MTATTTDCGFDLELHDVMIVALVNEGLNARLY